MTLQEIHAMLREAYERLLELYGHLPPGISADTTFAIGEATGLLSKAKALVGRDIDDARHTVGDSK